MSDTESAENKPVVKRRKSNIKNWKRNKIPASKCNGVEHKGWKGNIVPARIQSPPCG